MNKKTLQLGIGAGVVGALAVVGMATSIQKREDTKLAHTPTILFHPDDKASPILDGVRKECERILEGKENYGVYVATGSKNTLDLDGDKYKNAVVKVVWAREMGSDDVTRFSCDCVDAKLADGTAEKSCSLTTQHEAGLETSQFTFKRKGQMEYFSEGTLAYNGTKKAGRFVTTDPVHGCLERFDKGNKSTVETDDSVTSQTNCREFLGVQEQEFQHLFKVLQDEASKKNPGAEMNQDH